jgi:hypothetical protein
MEQAVYYHHSGKVPAKSLVLTLIFLPLTAWFCAWAYVNLVWYIPFVFLNFVLTIIFSMLACIPVYFGVSDGGIRNRTVVYALCFLAGGCFVYFQWAYYCSYIMKTVKLEELQEITSRTRFRYFLQRPDKMVQIGTVILNEGTWSMFGSRVSGFVLLLFWMTEAAFSIGFGTWFILDLLKFPFSESMNTWLKEEFAPRGVKPLGVPVEEMRMKLETGDVNFLTAAEAASPHDSVRYELAVYKTSDLSEIWLSLFEVKVEFSKGKEEKTPKVLIKQVRLSKRNYEKLLKTNFYTQAAPTINPAIEKTEESLEPTRYGPPPGRPF